MIESLTGTHADWIVALARIVLGIIFFAHGAQKLLGWFSGPGLASSMRTFTKHLHLPSALAFLVIAGEFFSGVGLIVGLFSRIAALVIVLTMVGAIATVSHWSGECPLATTRPWKQVCRERPSPRPLKLEVQLLQIQPCV